jgi:hypothetical protein
VGLLSINGGYKAITTKYIVVGSKTGRDSELRCFIVIFWGVVILIFGIALTVANLAFLLVWLFNLQWLVKVYKELAGQQNIKLNGVIMLRKVIIEDNILRLTQIVVNRLQQGWIVAGGIAFDGQKYLQAMTRS